ncbi:MAG TPA: hypothetical protein DEA62_05010, partial [Coxiellaceae bacterium]|nr:hypothetical protein [Coxiellaceae bacterium]HBY55800.1 hypothetical protein [Coxiellaceae bacterium]
MCQYIYKILLVFVISSLLLNVAANAANNSDTGPWSVLFYRGNTAKQVFGDVMIGKYNSYGEEIYAAELAYTLDQNNLVR